MRLKKMFLKAVHRRCSNLMGDFKKISETESYSVPYFLGKYFTELRRAGGIFTRKKKTR